MSPTIRIDDEVFDALKKHAEPFVDTPNSGIDSIIDAIACQNYLPWMPCQPTAFGHITARSRHPSGVMASYCDGSVHFIPNNIALATWQNLSTMNDGVATTLD